MKKSIACIWLILIASVNLHAQKKNNDIAENSARNVVYKKPLVKYGIASYYAKKFNGRHTANGEIYNGTKYTAACNVLPLGTWIKVTNIHNDKSVIVKVNDRLHPKNKRLVDLSRIAATDLSFTGRGLTRVKVEVLHDYHP